MKWRAMLKKAKKKVLKKQLRTKEASLEHKTILKVTIALAKIKIFKGNKNKERGILVEVYKIVNDYFENEDDDDGDDGSSSNS